MKKVFSMTPSRRAGSNDAIKRRGLECQLTYLRSLTGIKAFPAVQTSGVVRSRRARSPPARRQQQEQEAFAAFVQNIDGNYNRRQALDHRSPNGDGMGQKLPVATSFGEQSLAVRPERIRNIEAAKRNIPLQLIADALIRAGHISLDAQAKALGLSRSTAWTIVKTKHKLGRLNAETTARILANPETPVSVRVIVETLMVRERTRRTIRGRNNLENN